MRIATVFLSLIIAGCTKPATTAQPDDPEQSESMRSDMRGSFGTPGAEASWWNSVTNVSVRGDTAVLTTNMPATDNRVHDICSAASSYVYRNQNQSLGIVNVQVVGMDGAILVNRRGLTGKC